MVRPATMRRLLWVTSVVAATAGCGQSTRSGESRGNGDSGGSGGRAGNASSTGGSVTGGSVTGGTSGTGGTAGSPSAGSGNPGGAPGVDITSSWAMFHFGDPVAVELAQNGTELHGRGCCAGLNPNGLGTDCCGEIVGGSIVDGRAEFGFSFELGETFEYSADVFVSEDGRRMLGSFSASTEAMAWVPITITEPDDPGWLRSTDAVLDEVAAARTGSYLLTLAGTPTGGSAYSPDTDYVLRLVGSPVPMVSGDLGPFWAGEMAWQEGEQTLVIGPVPVTNQVFPIGLRLRFEDVVLSAVEAQMPSGDLYLFSATPE